MPIETPLDSSRRHRSAGRHPDLGDGIACLEFRSKANILDDGVVQLIGQSPALLKEKGFVGLVLKVRMKGGYILFLFGKR